MASVGHIAVAVVAARTRNDPHRALPSVSSLLFWSLVSIAADCDFIAFAVGIPYGAPLGHRGATHSLAFAAALTSAIALVARAKAKVGCAHRVDRGDRDAESSGARLDDHLRHGLRVSLALRHHPLPGSLAHCPDRTRRSRRC